MNRLFKFALFSLSLLALSVPAQAITVFSSTQGDINLPGLTPAAPGGQLKIDNAPIGATTPAAGNFTTLGATGAVTGASVAATGAVTGATVTATGAVSGGSAIFTGTAPVPTGTGSPTITTGSTDTAGEVTAGSSATSVIVTFSSAKTNAPFCVVRSQAQVASFAYSISTTAITITQTATSGNLIDYICVQH